MANKQLGYNDKVVLLDKMCQKLAVSNVALLLSGGVDSSLLACLLSENAKHSGTKVYAYTVTSNLQTDIDIEQAKNVATDYELVHKLIKLDILNGASITSNPHNRCYLCKKYICKAVVEEARSIGINTIVDGNNKDDENVYRPGMQAKNELGIISPLLECSMTKSDVRILAKKHKLSVSTRPSSPCLATRFPYDTELSETVLSMVGRAEHFIRENVAQLKNVDLRVRVHGDLARIEVAPDNLQNLTANRQIITDGLKKIGYKFITVDLAGFASGCYDKE